MSGQADDPMQAGTVMPVLSDALLPEVRREINATLRPAFLVGALFGIFAGTFMLLIHWVGLMPDMAIPALWAFVCGISVLGLYVMARRDAIPAVRPWIVVLPLVSLPTLIFVVSWWILPGGAATYLTGPPSYLYFFLVVLTGFWMQARVSIGASIFAAAQFIVAYQVAREHLQHISGPDALFLQDLKDPVLWGFKAVMLVLTGIAVGVLSRSARRLIGRMIDKERERASLDRLFGQYVSPAVRDRLMASDAVRGEMRDVVVLFCDIRSFTTMCEGMSPAAVVEHLNRYLDEMVACIQAEGGVIDKFIGDAIMATFGGVAPLETPAASAVKAALKMQQELAILRSDWTLQNLPLLRSGIGIHYGPVLLGPIGSEQRREFTVIGDTVNVAARLEALTKDHACGIIISDAVQHALPAELKEAFAGLGSTTVKGKTLPVEIFGNT
ncbi:MAG TPA: adenylate/guanylate cyclase domain-containing protein [Candidatus Ozemobacteraceae bacterium]|nr:adenylate/guanylate cyclase domain-containing protein [Candidatus Ozemobacteraceae bacterium]